jgi:hypothetical protein
MITEMNDKKADVKKPYLYFELLSEILMRTLCNKTEGSVLYGFFWM